MFNIPKRILFSNGIPGFEDVKEFILEEDQEEVFFRLRGEHCPEVVFLLLNPFLVFPDYAFDLKEADQDYLELSNIDDARIFVIVTLQNELCRATANLLGPIVINSHNNKGMQVVLEDSSYHTRHQIFADQREKED